MGGRKSLAVMAAVWPALKSGGYSPHHAKLFGRPTRLAGNHAALYGGVRLANEDIVWLLEGRGRAMP